MLMKEEVADVVFVDPPYNVKVDGHVSGNGKVRHREFAQASGELSRDEFIRFLTASCSALARHSKNGAIHYVCIDWRHADELIVSGRNVYSELKNIAVWVKTNPGMGSLYRSQHELVFVFKSGTARHTNNIELGKHGRNRTNVWYYDSATTQGRKGNNLLELKKQAYQVGYRKPPAETRFKKGQSGNPSGRPKRVPIVDPGLLIEAIDNEEIEVVENGKRKRMPKVEIEFRQLFTKALKGDLRAARHLFKMAAEYLSPEVRNHRDYEFMGESKAIKCFGRKWPDRVRELNMSRGYLP